MATKLAVWNQALIHLGKSKLTTLTDDVEARYVFDDAWAGVVEEAFNEGDWNFAKKSASLAESSTGTAALGFTYVYDYPSDYVRTIAVSNEATFSAKFTAYADQGGYLHSSTNPVYLRYISNALDDDDDVPSWPTMFWRYVALKLAYETCNRLTNGASLEDRLEVKMEKALRKAKSVDARNEQGKVLPSGSWMEARGGYRWGSSDIQVQASDGIVLGEGDV